MWRPSTHMGDGHILAHVRWPVLERHELPQATLAQLLADGVVDRASLNSWHDLTDSVRLSLRADPGRVRTTRAAAPRRVWVDATGSGSKVRSRPRCSATAASTATSPACGSAPAAGRARARGACGTRSPSSPRTTSAATSRISRSRCCAATGTSRSASGGRSVSSARPTSATSKKFSTLGFQLQRRF